MAADNEAAGHIYSQEVARAQEAGLTYTTPGLAPNNRFLSVSLIKVIQPPKTVPALGDQMWEHLSKSHFYISASHILPSFKIFYASSGKDQSL